MRTYTLQPAPRVDHVTEDGTELTQLPYPFFVSEDGSVGRQDLWQGRVSRIVGFLHDPKVQQVDLWWEDAAADPQRAVGMYAVFADSKGDMGSLDTVVQSLDVQVAVTEGQNRATSSHKEQ